MRCCPAAAFTASLIGRSPLCGPARPPISAAHTAGIPDCDGAQAPVKCQYDAPTSPSGCLYNKHVRTSLQRRRYCSKQEALVAAYPTLAHRTHHCLPIWCATHLISPVPVPTKCTCGPVSKTHCSAGEPLVNGARIHHGQQHLTSPLMFDLKGPEFKKGPRIPQIMIMTPTILCK